MTYHSKPSEEFKKFDKAMDKIMSVPRLILTSVLRLLRQRRQASGIQSL